ncbi:MAG TPA: SDR family oxidoreductase [Halieaceae bacterium]|jgi:NAD(P)-dependent dehydrogenase (short-subunit alcohol dehydrogenase family)|uniref:SDR family NAD(P)-dependent oxidoreductase n=1 Tax=Haliea TaxID=475794 RepID=UPI000410816B|nr:MULTISPECIES: SDR family oxidoreductase [Haliea]HAN68534.1 SDR family oxidoreductase [Halieaceae bacterium]MAD64527.1 SDR family oxidoreductase [Haliea sp.]MAY93024.1 SDR family oxidoreductase [Haliea sp.]MBK39773.1 SDR family oxidoreductase [Haliea sp.]MBP69434.1 SDR family oxidoreductase [Haliea sp.]|tara:strand:+ start:3737 stop:4519 length:783 start_codon:yes stop_codon:yes gene_type:complete
MYDDLEGRVAVITGAGSGIGRATALLLNREGCRLVLNDLRGEDAEATRNLLENPDSAVIHAGDIGDPATAEQLSELATETFGALHIWVNNAARSLFGPLAECSNEEWDSVFQVTLTGAFYGVRSALKAMRRNQGPQSGAIVNIASGAALAGEEGLGAYGAAKAGLVNLTRTTAVENARYGIRCNVILPGPIATPPMLQAASQSPGGVDAWASQIVPGRLGEPDEIANAICFLVSQQASYINGSLLSVDGGVSARTNSPRF